MLLFQLTVGKIIYLEFQKSVHGPEIVESSRELFQNIGSLAIHQLVNETRKREKSRLFFVCFLHFRGDSVQS